MDPEAGWKLVKINNRKNDDLYMKVCVKDYELIKHMSITANKDGYPRIRSYKNWKDQTILVHQLIMGRTKKGYVVDHINQDIKDNRRCNLRVVSKSINAVNSSKKRKNKTGFMGVYFDKNTNKFDAYCTKDSKRKYLGAFKTGLEAAKARDEYFKSVHGEHPSLNFPLNRTR